jgi:rhodanese-related sulfurtransferase
VEGIRALEPGLEVNTPPDVSLPNTASVTFPGRTNSVLMAELDYYGIAVSAGSACNTQSDEPSHVLTAVGLSPEQARRTLRFSLSDLTTGRDIDYALRAMADIVSGRAPAIAMVSPAQLDEKILFDPSTYVLDVRFWYDRLALKALPGAHEASFPFISRYVGRLPRDRNILVVCQAGANAPVAAYYLRSRGFRKLSFLVGGMVAWRAAQPGLYERHAGRDTAAIKL